MNLKNYSDFLLFIFTIYFNAFYVNYFNNDSLLYDSDNWLYWDFAIIGFMIALWLKVLGFLKLTKRFGVLLKII